MRLHVSPRGKKASYLRPISSIHPMITDVGCDISFRTNSQYMSNFTVDYRALGNNKELKDWLVRHII